MASAEQLGGIAMDDYTPPAPAMKLAVASMENANYVTGRRAYFKYRDLGVTEATKGFMRAQVTSAEQGMSKPTGWHVHKCQAQLVYMLSGWVDLEFADRKVRIKAGDSIMIPGDTPHNETATSDTFELLEVSVPADMGTEPCEAPPGH
jgi:quercetin dioxygenase-like cupin family protein